MLLHLYTRIYSDGDAANAADPRDGGGARRSPRQLTAMREPGNGNAVYRCDIRLQGDNETVFFEV
jgi:protocatechuate 3,4-dioxygenase alpha subunit